jgi:hypothetical protein
MILPHPGKKKVIVGSPSPASRFELNNRMASRDSYSRFSAQLRITRRSPEIAGNNFRNGSNVPPVLWTLPPKQRERIVVEIAPTEIAYHLAEHTDHRVLGGMTKDGCPLLEYFLKTGLLHGEFR